MRALLGEVDSSDGFNWAEFRMEDADDVNRLEKEMKNELEALRQAEIEASMGIGMSITGGSVGKSFQKLEKQARKELETKKNEETGLLTKFEDANSEFPLADHDDVDVEDENFEEETDEVQEALKKAVRMP